MYLFHLFLWTVSGASLFSFACCMSGRLINGEDFIRGRSVCGHCRHTLRWYDTVPLLSCLVLHGKCRYCGERIPLRESVWEAAGALLAVGVRLWHTGSTAHKVIVVMYAAVLAVMSENDRRTMRIPVFLQYVIAVLGMADIAAGSIPLTERVVSACILSLPLWIVCRFRYVMGEGDVKLLAVSGFLLGRQIIPVFAVSAWTGTAVYAAQRVFRQKNPQYLPYVPLFAVAYLLCEIYNETQVYTLLKK